MVGIALYAKEESKVLQQQDIALYYVNISGKQRVLAQRIVFLSQVITTNYALRRDNSESFIALRNCINELRAIHSVLQSFVIAKVVGSTEESTSTLGDVYFGSGGLSFKIEAFFESANQLFFIQSVQEILQVNQKILEQLDGDNGLLTSLELATLSQQIYAQNILKIQQKYTQWLLYGGVFICVLLIILLLVSTKKKGKFQ